jgi:hypothetical protein
MSTFSVAQEVAPSSIFFELSQSYQAKNYTDAFKIAENLFDEWAGDPEFDYLYAKSALKLQKYDEAVFALERVVVNWPTHFGARYLLGIAYTKQVNLEKAKNTFNQLLAQSTEQETKVKIEQLISSIEKQKQAIQNTIKSKFYLKAGHDSNVNSGAVDDRIVIGNLPILLDPRSVQQADYYQQANYSLAANWRLDQYQSVRAGLNLAGHRHNEQSEFDRNQLAMNISMENLYERFSYSYGAKIGIMTLDNHTYQKEIGGVANFSYFPLNHVGLLLNANVIKQNNEQDDDLSSLLYSVNTGVRYFQPRWSIRLLAGYTSQQADNDDAQYYSRKNTRLTLSYLYKLSNTVMANFNCDYKDIRYEEINPVFLQARDEVLVTAQIGLSYYLSETWQMNTAFSYTDKNSSIPLYNYQRKEWHLGVAYAF